jgi:hypothetical protein
MPDNRQAGKGPEIRKGANLRAYWEADYWKIQEKKKQEAIKNEQSVVLNDAPDKSTKSS